MKCPYCGYQESKVVDSRHSEDGLSIRRRRECLSCQKRFTTYETVECLPIVVIKRGGIRQAFDRNKILNGMLRACEKRPVPMQLLENATDEIEQSIQNSLDREISTEKIGELVMEKLLRQESIMKRFPEDTDLLEDVIIENKQAIEMCTIYRDILSGTMDAFASVISNNLNIVMKVLTSVTVLMTIPTMVFSYYGMNVSGLQVPVWWFPTLVSGVLALAIYGFTGHSVIL